MAFSVSGRALLCEDIDLDLTQTLLMVSHWSVGGGGHVDSYIGKGPIAASSARMGSIVGREFLVGAANLIP